MTTFNKHSPLRMDADKLVSKPKAPRKVQIRQSLFGEDISSLAHKPVDPSQLKPVSALDIPNNCIRELDFVQLKTYLMLASPSGIDMDQLEKQVADYHAIVRLINQRWAAPLNF